MTKFDVRNYFEKIYGVKVAAVHTRIQKGKLRRDKKQPTKLIKKSSDTKVAYLTLVTIIIAIHHILFADPVSQVRISFIIVMIFTYSLFCR